MFPSAESVKKKVFEAGAQNMPLTVVVDCAHVAVVDYTAALVSSVYKRVQAIIIHNKFLFRKNIYFLHIKML